MATSVADANFLLGWRNHLLYETAVTLACTSGAVAGGSLDALRTMQLSDRVTFTATSDGGGNATVEVEWAKTSGTVAVGLLGLLNYGVSAPGAAYVTVTLEASGPGGSFSSNATWSRPSADFPLHMWAINDAVVQADTVKLSVLAAFGGAGDVLTVTAGGLWASRLWWLPSGLATGWKETLEDSSQMRVSKGRQGYPSRGPRGRVFSGRAIGVPFEWAFGSEVDPTVIDIQQLQYRCGTSEPVVIFPRTRNRAGERSVHVMHRLGVYGHFRELGWIAEATGDNYDWSEIVVAELM